MIFLHGLSLVVYEYQRYLKYRDAQRQEQLMIDNAVDANRLAVAAAAERTEASEAATAAADAGYAAWKEAMIFAAVEAERVSAYSKQNAGKPATLEVKRLEAVAIEKAHAYAALEQERAAAADALERAQSAVSKADTVPAKQKKPEQNGIFGGLKSGFML